MRGKGYVLLLIKGERPKAVGNRIHEWLNGSGRNSAIATRRSPRFAIDVAVKMHVASPSGVSTFVNGRGTNISERGMALGEIPPVLSVGQTIWITITFPNFQRSIRCWAKVRNRGSYGYGLEFIDPEVLDSELLLRVCKASSLVQ